MKKNMIRTTVDPVSQRDEFVADLLSSVPSHLPLSRSIQCARAMVCRCVFLDAIFAYSYFTK